MERLEEVEEKKFVRWVRARRWIAIKQQTKGPYGSTGFNDLIVLAPYRTTVLFEFKKIGEVAEKLQVYRHKQVKRLHHITHVVYKAAEAWKILQEEIAQAEEVSKGVRKVRRVAASRRILSRARSR